MLRTLLVAAAWLAALLAAAGARADTGHGADDFPNVPLVTQDGRTVRFHDDLLKDRKVLINFMFTRCDQVCPLDTAKLVQVAKLLGERAGRDIHLYSISLDPEHDTPAALKAYAERFGARWTFLTGTRADIDRVRERLGDRKSKEAHANVVRAGDVARGQWIRLPLAADARYLAMETINTFEPGWSEGRALPSIEQAPRLAVSGPGQILFNNRCGACHAFGQGDRLGPDLRGVTARRERDWLLRFLSAPDKLRAAGDPVAQELAARYPVRMPNLGLTRKELGELLAYLAAQDAGQAPPDATAAGDSHAGHANPAHH